jgi:membrane protein
LTHKIPAHPVSSADSRIHFQSLCIGFAEAMIHQNSRFIAVSGTLELKHIYNKDNGNGFEVAALIRRFFKWIGSRVPVYYLRMKAQAERIAAFRFFETVLVKYGRDEGSMRAGAITYYVLQSIFPLLIGLISLLGFFMPYGSIRQAVSSVLRQVLPVFSDSIVQVLDTVITLRGPIGVISLLLLLWSGSNLFANLRRAINRAWNVQDRQFFIAKGIDLIMVAGSGIVLLLSVSTLAAVEFFGDSIFSNIPVLAGRSVSFILSLGLFLLIFKYLPNTRTYWRWIWPGALITAVFFQVGAFIFIFYIANFVNFENVYGSLGSVIVFLYWIYLSAEVLILSAELNSELYHLRSKAKHVGHTDGL